MDELYSPNYVEYTYEKKAEGKKRILKYLLVFGYIIFVLGFFFVCYTTRFIPIFAISPLLTWILVYFTWHFVSYDVYYVFEHGEMEFGKIIKRKRELKRQPQLKIRTQEALLTATYKEAVLSDEYKSVVRVHDFSCSLSSPSLIMIIFKNAGKNEAALFESTPKLPRLLQRYTTVSEKLKTII